MPRKQRVNIVVKSDAGEVHMSMDTTMSFTNVVHGIRCLAGHIADHSEDDAQAADAPASPAPPAPPASPDPNTRMSETNYLLTILAVTLAVAALTGQLRCTPLPAATTPVQPVLTGEK